MWVKLVVCCLIYADLMLLVVYCLLFIAGCFCFYLFDLICWFLLLLLFVCFTFDMFRIG